MWFSNFRLLLWWWRGGGAEWSRKEQRRGGRSLLRSLLSLHRPHLQPTVVVLLA